MSRSSNFTLEASDSTPEIHFDADSGEFRISGRSIPENATAFYKPILDWLHEYASNAKDMTNIVLYLEYINSISQKMLFDLLQTAESIKESGKRVHIEWRYDINDTEMQEEGRILKSKLGLDLDLVPVSDR